jgi:hypothetical protein
MWVAALPSKEITPYKSHELPLLFLSLSRTQLESDSRN